MAELQHSPLSTLLSWTDRFVPTQVDRADPSALFRARLVVAFAASVVVWIPVFAALTGAVGGPMTALAILAFGLPMLLAPALMRRHGVTAGAQLLNVSVFATIYATSVLNGGPALQAHVGLGLVPVLAAALGGMRAGASWTGIVVTGGVALYLLDAVGVPFPRDLGVDGYPWFQATVAVAVPVILLCLIGTYEITRDDAVRAARTREEDLTGILDTAPDGLLVVAEDGHIERVNPAAARLFGLPEAALAGASTHLLFPGGLPTGEAGFFQDLEARRADGARLPCDVAVGRLAAGGRPRFVALVRDVSTRHESERALGEARDRAVQASRAKSTFLANMSHELRTPLNAILGYAELVAEELGPSSPLTSDLARISGAGRHLLQLIDEVLDLSKIEAGRLVLERHTIRLDELVDSAIVTIRPLAERNGNEVVRDVPVPVGEIVGDPVRVRQVLLNLLSNAAKFTEGGRITLRAQRLAQTTTRGERVRFEVQDEGIGMSRETLDRLFTEFVQADPSTTRRFGGTGLGLAITRRLVKMMGGEIEVRSEVGVGSTFTIDLPTTATEVRTTPASPAARGGVLVVDDDPWARDVLARTLDRAGIPVAVACDGDEGLRLARHLEPKVIVLDVLMPGRDGWEVLAELKRDPATKAIPVVVVTVTRDRGLAVALGAAAFLEKPYPRDQLVQLLRGLLPQSASGHALVVEDDTDMRTILSRSLSSAGWSVAEAQDGSAALEALDIRAPDVIVLDLMMPQMDGFELVERLHSQPTWRGIPVVVVTALDLDGPDLERLRGRVDRVLRKGDLPRDALLQEVLGAVQRSTPVGDA